MCIDDIFGGGGGGGSTQSTSTTTTNTSVSTTSNVSVPIGLSVDTSDLADAIKALAAGGIVNAQAQAAAQVTAAKTAAVGQIAAAEIAAGQGPSWSTIIMVGAALAGLAVTMHIIKVRGLK